MNVALWGSMWCGWCYITRFGGSRFDFAWGVPLQFSETAVNEEGGWFGFDFTLNGVLLRFSGSGRWVRGGGSCEDSVVRVM